MNSAFHSFMHFSKSEKGKPWNLFLSEVKLKYKLVKVGNTYKYKMSTSLNLESTESETSEID